VTHRSGTSRSRSFPDNRGDYSRLRAAVARCLMSEPVVRALEPGDATARSSHRASS
jgi:hypothetical protein